MKPLLSVLAAAFMASPAYGDVEDIVKRVEVGAPVAEVFSAFASNEGVQSFFSRGSNVDFQPDGNYEILFFPDKPVGQRGAEGMKVLAIEPNRRLAITWNAPPAWPEIRKQRTVVTINFAPIDEHRTEVTLHHSLWGQSEAWQQVNDYFQGGWDVILFRLQHRFDEGPIDWSNPPRPS